MKTANSFRSLLSCIGLIVWTGAAAQPKEYPANYFRWPLNIRPEIVANMGELRTNHWHMGLDIRTNQRENQPVYAAAQGYIAKIRIERSGFGRAIFINHPNGLTTLYAHLNDFNPALEKYVTEKQYERESWAIELEIPKDKFPVNKGDFIAYSGNTGGSQGPHVHFEIRDTKTDEVLNPQLFGIPLKDEVKPVLLKLAMYDRSKPFYETGPQVFSLKKDDGGYIISKNQIIRTGLNRISFGLQTFDRLSGSSNEDGVYSARIFWDDRFVSGFLIDRISYRETGYMNAHIDFRYKHNGGSYFQLLSPLPGDKGGAYLVNSAEGVIGISDTLLHKARIEVTDAFGNMSELNFQLQHDPSLSSDESRPANANYLVPNQASAFRKPGFEVQFTENSLYDSVISYYQRSDRTHINAVSDLHRLNDNSIPVHDEITVRIQPDKVITQEMQNKLIMRRSHGNGNSHAKATWDGRWITASFGDLGSFQAFADFEAPELNELGKGDTINLSAASRISFRPTDNFGIKDFRAELDGRWLRFTNDKGRVHIYEFDERCPYGVHHLRVTVEDLAGNKTEKSWWFKRYPYTPPKKKVTKKKTSTKKKGTSGKTTGDKSTKKK